MLKIFIPQFTGGLGREIRDRNSTWSKKFNKNVKNITYIYIYIFIECSERKISDRKKKFTFKFISCLLIQYLLNE